MAGSYMHCVKVSVEKGFVPRSDNTELLDHLGDASEAIEEMLFMIDHLAGGDRNKILGALNAYHKEHSPGRPQGYTFEELVEFHGDDDDDEASD